MTSPAAVANQSDRPFVAALIALEKTVAPGGRAVTLATALILLVLGIAVIAAPGSVPGLTVPGGMSM